MNPFKTGLLRVACCAALFPLHGISSECVVAWGQNVLGQAPPSQGRWTGALSSSNHVLVGVLQISAGDHHALIVNSDRTVTGFGFDAYGQVTGVASGNAYPTNGIVTVNGKPLTGVISIASGANHSMALTTDGVVVAWGDNRFNQASVPSNLRNVVAIAAGGNTSLAVIRGGSVVVWGAGREMRPPGSSEIIECAVGGRAPRFVALRSDRTIATWGRDTTHGDIHPPSGLSNVVSVAAGFNHSLALRQDGTIYGWGANAKGQATGSRTTVSPYISSGIVTLNGTVLTNIVAIAAGREFSVAVARDGSIRSWGANAFGQTDVPAKLGKATAIAAGSAFCVTIVSTDSMEAFRTRQ